MRKSPEAFIALVEYLSVNPYYVDAAKALGCGVSTVFRWINESNKNPTEFTFEWNGVTAPLHEHCRTAVKHQAMLIEAWARKIAIEGWDEEVTFQGRRCFEEDETYLGVSDEDVKWLSPTGHRYKLDEQGRPIPIKIKRRISEAMMAKILSSHLPKLYGSQITQTIDVRHSHVKVVQPKAPEMKVIEGTTNGNMLPPPRAEDKLAEIRARMLNEANAHLARTDRQTTPRGVVSVIPPGDAEINDRPRTVSKPPYAK